MNLSCSEKVVAEVKLYFLWRRHDSNVRTTLRFDLQSNAFGHFATPPFILYSDNNINELSIHYYSRAAPKILSSRRAA